MVLRSSDREKPLPGARINLGPAPTATTSNAGETKVGIGRRGRILHLGPPDPAPIPPPRRPDPRSTLAKPRDRKPAPPPPPSRSSAPRSPSPRSPAPPAAPPKAAVTPPKPKVRQRFDLQAFCARVKQVEAQRTRLHREIEERERLVHEAERSLERRDWPVIGLLTRRSQEALEERLAALVDELDALYGQLEEAVVDADFEIDARAQALFAELTQQFDRLQPSGSGEVPPGASLRASTPRNGDQQQPATLDLVTSPTRPLRLQHGHDKALFVFPRFVAVVGRVGGCGLHDIRDLFVSARAAPSANDVGELLLTLPTGFDEAYRFRGVAACEALGDAFATYLDALPPLPPVVTPAVAPPSGVKPPAPPASRPVPTSTAADGKPAPSNVERAAPPEPRPVPLSPAPPSLREPAVALLEPQAERPQVRLMPLPQGLAPATEDPFVAAEVRREAAIRPPAPPASDKHPHLAEPPTPPMAPTPDLEPARHAAQALPPHAANDSTALPVDTAARTPAPIDQTPLPDHPLPVAPTPPIAVPSAPTVDLVAPLPPEPDATPTVEWDARQSASSTAARTPAPIDQTPLPDHPLPVAPTSPIAVQSAPTVDLVAPLPAEPDSGPTVERDAQRLQSDTVATTTAVDQAPTLLPDLSLPAASDPPVVEQSTLAVDLEAPRLPEPAFNPTAQQDAPRCEPDRITTTRAAAPENARLAAVPVDPPLASPAPSGIVTAVVPTEKAARTADRDSGPPPAALAPLSMSPRWDTAASAPVPAAVPSTPVPPPMAVPRRAEPVQPAPRRYERSGDETGVHWSEPLSLHVPVWPPISPPPAQRRAPPDDETVQHWSEPVSLIQIPSWPPLGAAPAADTAAPASPGVSVRLSAAARATVDAVVANSRAGLHTSARVGAASLAAVTTYIGDVRTSVANRRSQRRMAPTEPQSVRIRPSRLSVPLPIASLLSRRAWRWSAAATALVAAIAVTSPFLWRQHSEPMVAASSPPPLPPLPPSPPAPASAPTPPVTPAAAAPQPKADIPSPPRPAPRESRPLTGIEVVQLQGRLRALGFNAGPADGVIGPRTVTAVREFQAAHGLAVTGIIDSAVFDDVSVAQAKTVKPGAP